MALKAHHVDAHVSKSQTTKDRGNKEQVDKAVRVEVAQVDLNWEHKDELFIA